MNLNAATLKVMIAKGLTLEDVADIVAASEVTRDPTAAERQARCRARKREGVSRRDVTRDPPNDIILTPGDTPEPSGSAPKQNRDRGTRLPDDWALPVEWRDWTMQRRNWTAGEVAEEATLFANYWQARSGSGAIHRDWFKTWQNWTIRSHRKDGAKPNAAPNRETCLERAEFFDRMGKRDEAAEWRRKAHETAV